MKKALALVAVAGIAGIASAQSATMHVTANGGANATVAPGASVTINATASWSGAVQFAGFTPQQGFNRDPIEVVPPLIDNPLAIAREAGLFGADVVKAGQLAGRFFWAALEVEVEVTLTFAGE